MKKYSQRVNKEHSLTFSNLSSTLIQSKKFDMNVLGDSSLDLDIVHSKKRLSDYNQNLLCVQFIFRLSYNVR